MGYFNYHAKIKRLIKERRLKNFEFRDEYHGISPVMLLFFDDDSVMPVREHKFEEYLKIIEEGETQK